MPQVLPEVRLSDIKTSLNIYANSFMFYLFANDAPVIKEMKKIQSALSKEVSVKNPDPLLTLEMLFTIVQMGAMTDGAKMPEAKTAIIKIMNKFDREIPLALKKQFQPTNPSYVPNCLSKCFELILQNPEHAEAIVQTKCAFNLVLTIAPEQTKSLQPFFAELDTNLAFVNSVYKHLKTLTSDKDPIMNLDVLIRNADFFARIFASYLPNKVTPLFSTPSKPGLFNTKGTAPVSSQLPITGQQPLVTTLPSRPGG